MPLLPRPRVSSSKTRSQPFALVLESAATFTRHARRLAGRTNVSDAGEPPFSSSERAPLNTPGPRRIGGYTPQETRDTAAVPTAPTRRQIPAFTKGGSSETGTHTARPPRP